MNREIVGLAALVIICLTVVVCVNLIVGAFGGWR